MIKLIRGKANSLLVIFWGFFFESFKPLIKGAGLTHERASATLALFLMLLPSNLIVGKIGFGPDPEWLFL